MEKSTEKKGKKLPPVTAPLAYAMGFSEKELQLLNTVLGRGPTEFEVAAAVNLWSDDFLEEHLLFQSRQTAEQETILDASGAGSVIRLDLGSDQPPLGAVAGHANLLVNRFPPFAPGALLSELFESLACAGCVPVSVSLALRVGEARAANLYRGVQAIVESTANFLNSIGVPPQGVSITTDPAISEHAYLSAVAFGRALPLGERTPPPRESMVIFVGAPCRKPAEPDLAHRVNYQRGALQFASTSLTRTVIEGVTDLYRHGLILDGARSASGGIVGALFALATRRDVGLRLEIDKIPCEEELSPKEIFSSRQPHQVLLLCTKEKHREVVDSLQERGLKALVVGQMIEERQVQLSSYHNLIGSLPFTACDLKTVSFPPPPEQQERSLGAVEEPMYPEDSWLDVLASANVASRSAVLERFDEQLGVVALTERSGDTALFQLHPDQVAAVTYQSLAPQIGADPLRGLKLSLAAGMREIALQGAQALSFLPIYHAGDLNKEKALHALQRAVAGADEGAKHLLQLGQRASFFNAAEPSSPSVNGGVFVFGLLKERTRRLRWRRKMVDHSVLLLSRLPLFNENTAGEYLLSCLNRNDGAVPDTDLKEERRLCRLVQSFVQEGILSGGVSINSGGLAPALTRLAFKAREGVVLSLFGEGRSDALLFNEVSGRFLLCCAPENRKVLWHRIESERFLVLGEGILGGDRIAVEGAVECGVSLVTARKIYKSSFTHVIGA